MAWHFSINTVIGKTKNLPRNNAESSNEALWVDILIKLGVFAAICVVAAWLNKRNDSNKGNGSNKTGENANSGQTFSDLGKQVKKDCITRIFDGLDKLPNEKMDELLDHVTIKATPEILSANIKLQKLLLEEYKKFNHARFSVLSFPIDDILNYKGSTKSTLEKLNARYDENAVDDSCGWNCIPGEYASLFSKSEECARKTLRENGWNKSNLKLIAQHILHFGYTVLPFENTVQNDTDKFEDACMSLLKKNISKLDWVDDPNDPDGMEQHVNDDEGPVSYLLGQQEEWLGWAFLDNSTYSKGAISSHIGLTTSIDVLSGICKILNKDLNSSAVKK